MEYADPTGSRLSRPRRFGWILLGVWTLVAAASLIWNLVDRRRETYRIAYSVAANLLEKDMLYRRWAAEHGGVYVPVTPQTPPNPYLAHLPERDLQTRSGRRLTLMNPTYMNRQVYLMANRKGRPQGSLTSLKPLNPQNQPDPWEAAALKDLEKGQTEVRKVENLDGKKVMHLMRPIVQEQCCLPCHIRNDYQLGDVSGGISVALDMEPLLQAERSMNVSMFVGHALLWLLGAVGIVFGVHRLDRANAQIITLMNTDVLTGLANRRFFADVLDRSMSFASRHEQPLSIIMADLDHFKSVNDTYGHEAGDRVLIAFGQVLSRGIRKEDLAARFGGEEFILMLPGITSEDAMILAERLRKSLENLAFPALKTRVTASFGIAQYRPDDTFETLVNRSDEALYAAKAAGRNRVMTG